MEFNDKDNQSESFETAMNALSIHDITKAKHNKSLNQSTGSERHTSLFKTLTLESCQYTKTCHDAEDRLWYAASPLNKSQINALKKGHIKKRVIDLHGYSKESSIDTLNQTLKQAEQEKKNEWLIIHGKGNQSKSNARPILKNLVNAYLRKQPLVLAFASAQAKDGGNGAVYVLLKKSKKLWFDRKK